MHRTEIIPSFLAKAERLCQVGKHGRKTPPGLVWRGLCALDAQLDKALVPYYNAAFRRLGVQGACHEDHERCID